MKKSLPILSITLVTAIAVTMTACSSKQDTDTAPDLVLSASDTAGLADFQEWKAQNERKDADMYYMTDATIAPVNNTAKKATAVKKSAGTTATVPATAPAKKKGWSKAAKGAAIGTAGGAIAGVLISKKNRALGGVIGGVIGGGIGYGIGRGMDKKDGRY